MYKIGWFCTKNFLDHKKLTSNKTCSCDSGSLRCKDEDNAMLYVPLLATGKSGRHEPIFRLNCSSPTKAENWSNDVSPEAVSSAMSNTAFYTGQFNRTYQAVLVCSIAPKWPRLTLVCTYLWAYIDMNARRFRHDEQAYTLRSPHNRRGIRRCTYHSHLTLSVPLSLEAHETWSTGPLCMLTGYMHRN